ncbi:hypothetical protein [Thalassolituus oleivorans]|uniref:hypothetical protein n=1 Tax=Thalassolituus oleivorans TaxID=187493 RepID=UPI0023F4D590|nr:hypothetical protein [Thalassolituus oleivorans]
MGLVIGPLLLFWFSAMIFSIFIGWHIFDVSYLFAVIALFGVISGRFYAKEIVLQLKDEKEQWGFKADMHVATQERAFMLFIACVITYFLLNLLPAKDFIGAVIFYISLSVSYGTLHGILNNKKILSPYNIKHTY